MIKAQFYLILVISAASAVLLMQPWPLLLAQDSRVALGAASLLLLGLLSERHGVQFSISGRSASSSIAFIPLLAAIIAFPRPYALAISITLMGVVQFVFLRREPLRAAFNVAQVAITVELASLVFRSLGGTHGITDSVSIASAFGLAGTFFFANHLLVSIGLALYQGERVACTFGRLISTAGANLFYDLLTTPVAIVVAVLYEQYWVSGLLIVVLPLFLIRHSYWSIQKLRRANEDILEVLVKTIETRDPYTSGHSLRVAKLAKAIAEDLNLSTAKVDRVHMAALLHDIGKIETIYADLIRKESSLTDAERRVILTHAAKGAEFLTTLSSFNAEVIAAVRHHHERFDGTGYPDRLEGESIPLASRIIMLCDSIDAMLSDRPYRKALPIEKVRVELLRCSGTQFDPNIVHVILSRNTLERAATLVGPAAETRSDARTLSIAV